MERVYGMAEKNQFTFILMQEQLSVRTLIRRRLIQLETIYAQREYGKTWCEISFSWQFQLAQSDCSLYVALFDLSLYSWYGLYTSEIRMNLSQQHRMQSIRCSKTKYHLLHRSSVIGSNPNGKIKRTRFRTTQSCHGTAFSPHFFYLLWNWMQSKTKKTKVRKKYIVVHTANGNKCFTKTYCT